MYTRLVHGPALIDKLLIVKEMAPRHGFEPRFTAPKAAVLPLDDRGSRRSGTDWPSDFITCGRDSRVVAFFNSLSDAAPHGLTTEAIVNTAFLPG